MIPRRSLLVRWLKFNAVGAAGVLVQATALTALVSGFRLHYTVATALAVESAVLHNFFWHQRFTWKDRACARRGLVLKRLLLFNLTTGAISVAGNLLLMVLFAGVLGLHYLAANSLSIVLLSCANFAVSHTVVFRGTRWTASVRTHLRLRRRDREGGLNPDAGCPVDWE